MDLTAMLGASFVGAFLYASTTLLPVINPFSGAMFFVTLTGHLSDADRSYVAGRIALFSLIIFTAKLCIVITSYEFSSFISLSCSIFFILPLKLLTALFM